MSTELARKLRKRMPPAEARMWNLLRAPPFDALHFRRQVPIGPFFADFASHAARLVIEIDGDSHASDAAARYDTGRTARIRADGYSVVRIANRDVMNNLEGVAGYLLAELEVHPHPAPSGPPSPQGGGRSMGNR